MFVGSSSHSKINTMNTSLKTHNRYLTEQKRVEIRRDMAKAQSRIDRESASSYPDHEAIQSAQKYITDMIEILKVGYVTIHIFE